MILLASLLACAPEEAAFPVRATLDDGQILVGEAVTDTLQLEAGFGTIDVPLDDIGEVLPIEGGALASSNDHVTVWLRNGAELRGRWAEPELAMTLSVGGERVGVDLPTGKLERFQLQGGDLMPEGLVYRAHTIFGDDLLVDAERTRFGVESDLGRFAPFLSECEAITALEGALWEVALVGGTVLVGAPVTDALTLTLPLGPEAVTLRLDELVSLERQDWGDYSRYRDSYDIAPAAEATSPMRPARAAPESDTGWFDNGRQAAFKETR